MNKEQTLKAIKVMQAYVEGKKIQYISNTMVFDVDNPTWDWEYTEYRVKPVSKPSINWDHVHPDYKYLFTESDGSSYLVASEPTQSRTRWLIDIEDEDYITPEIFASFIPGDCDWKESLVQRPESV
jgi:hypothetical protein